MNNNIILMAHVLFGLVCLISALWVFGGHAPRCHGREPGANPGHVSFSGLPLPCGIAYLIAGYWYIAFYPADKAIILKGPWPLAQSTSFMESKEHLRHHALCCWQHVPVRYCCSRRSRSKSGRAPSVVLWVSGLGRRPGPGFADSFWRYYRDGSQGGDIAFEIIYRRQNYECAPQLGPTPATLSKYTVSFGICVRSHELVVNALLVVAKETPPNDRHGLRMKQAIGHQWATHSFAFAHPFFSSGSGSGPRAGNRRLPPRAGRNCIVAGTVIGALIILGFYLFLD